VLSNRTDIKVFQLALQCFVALDAREFDDSFVTREEALDEFSCFTERYMAPSQDLRRRHGLNERGFSFEDMICGQT
jgi:hypothetical protein